MTGIVMLIGQLGIVIGGFIGMEKAIGWYNKGDEKNGNSNPNKPNRLN